MLHFKVTKRSLSQVKLKNDCAHDYEEKKQLLFDRVAITTGGHPRIENFQHLADLGHAIEHPIPSLFTFNIADKAFKELMGTVVEPLLQSTEAARQHPPL